MTNLARKLETIGFTVVGSTQGLQDRWAREIKGLLGASGVEAISQPRANAGQIVFVDGSMPGLEEELRAIDRRGRAVYLIVDERDDGAANVMAWIDAGLAEDVVVHPFRALELQGKLKQYERMLLWEEVRELNASVSEVIHQLKDDLLLAERIQKTKLPSRFPEVKGMKVSTRYLAGMRSGGDHFDLADSKDGSQLSILLSDSSSHGLSSAVLSVLMRVAVKLSSDEVRSAGETVRKIFDEIMVTLKDKDHLSLFYGVLNRKDFTLRYLNLGSSRAFLARGKAGFAELPFQGSALTRLTGFPVVSEGVVVLQPDDRLVLVSDGFIDAAGGNPSTVELLSRFRSKDAADTLNELVYAVKSKFTEPDDFAAQDCTCVVMDVDSRLIRLQK